MASFEESKNTPEGAKEDNVDYSWVELAGGLAESFPAEVKSKVEAAYNTESSDAFFAAAEAIAVDARNKEVAIVEGSNAIKREAEAAGRVDLAQAAERIAAKATDSIAEEQREIAEIKSEPENDNKKAENGEQVNKASELATKEWQAIRVRLKEEFSEKLDAQVHREREKQLLQERAGELLSEGKIAEALILKANLDGKHWVGGVGPELENDPVLGPRLPESNLIDQAIQEDTETFLLVREQLLSEEQRDILDFQLLRKMVAVLSTEDLAILTDTPGRLEMLLNKPQFNDNLVLKNGIRLLTGEPEVRQRFIDDVKGREPQKEEFITGGTFEEVANQTKRYNNAVFTWANNEDYRVLKMIGAKDVAESMDRKKEAIWKR